MTPYCGIVAGSHQGIRLVGAMTNKLKKSNLANQIDLTVTDAIPIDITVLAPDGAVLSVNQSALDRIGLNADEVKSDGYFRRTCHPDDLEEILERRHAGLSKGVRFELEMRLLSKGGDYRWYLAHYNPLKDDHGQIVRWYVTVIDIDDRKRFEQRLVREEANLRTMIDSIRQVIVVLTPDGKTLYANRAALDKMGLTQAKVKEKGFFPPVFHPDDVQLSQEKRQKGLSGGDPFELEMRAMNKEGGYRWYLIQYNPEKDERGQIVRWYATSTDIDDQKKTEEQLRNENVRLDQERVYLAEQIRSEMGFEHIVGSSSALMRVLELVETVARSDSTVLLLGETGTGKELIARSVHERSRRTAKTFVKLNCAAIPTGLLESELFGHEKGAFTGAIIQKVGRMELADQGTLFLDEVGDIPVDIQPKLLRALQEKEFERLGSTHTRKVNLRLVAATNRNLEKMVADREFRSDLFYRLNVFPIRIPPLRERKEDIPLLATYFVEKFAKQMQKRITSIPVATMKVLTAWDWPGNIRELENFIERAVILTSGESLSASTSELRAIPEGDIPQESAPRTERDIARIVEQTIESLKKNRRHPSDRIKKEHEEIVRVLKESKGRVGGDDGAAVRLGLRRTTLIARMKSLGISSHDYA
jgi:formate hydrogenlyase transcriptional activator